MAVDHFKLVELRHASRLINHGPTVLVTSQHEQRRNLMAAAWSMPVEFTPPRIAVVIDKNTFTRELVAASGRFGICIPGASLVDLTYAVGSASGRDLDKFARYGIGTTPGPVLAVPLLQRGIVAWLECRRIPEPHTEEAYDTWFGEVVAAAADERAFSEGRWHVDTAAPELQTIHHLGGGNFVRAGLLLRANPLGEGMA